MEDNFQSSLLESLQYGFMDAKMHSDKTYAPRILVNNPDEERYVISDIDDELRRCDAFYFSVAFVTQSGIGMIKTQLFDLAERGIHGKIIISPYLDFNDPLALRELLKFKNVEVRMSPPELQLHAKYYMFERGGQKVIISGSSNLTANALKKNYEWNIKLTSAENGDIVHRTQEEFKRVWDMSDPLTEELIDRYNQTRNPSAKRFFEREETRINTEGTIIPNKMQEEALKSLQEARDAGQRRALVISATGTGKTYLSAFDVKQSHLERVLFVVHREQILRKALKSFQKVIGFDPSEACIYKSGSDISNKKYVFSTIQTLERDENLHSFDRKRFDYILVDEVHKSSAKTYKKVMDYFEPQFLMGMTATPERTDGQSIYELFDYNVAYEIRLKDALDEGLLCPFMYYGVTDIEINGELLNDEVSFSDLVSEDRVDHILEKNKLLWASRRYRTWFNFLLVQKRS
ncbi:DEAD/DEAH box helicase family protein [Alloscardovia theropitheci]|uniref:DEAD/DEAH box helicase family protein n=1 Tax=Alloscardovia theropitheci TaxID=2496842 RepID=UPI00196AF7DF|nr:DEAD/DEAH box helicase family protein [Alloscardovia theropitheci]